MRISSPRRAFFDNSTGRAGANGRLTDGAAGSPESSGGGRKPSSVPGLVCWYTSHTVNVASVGSIPAPGATCLRSSLVEQHPRNVPARVRFSAKAPSVIEGSAPPPVSGPQPRNDRRAKEIVCFFCRVRRLVMLPVFQTGHAGSIPARGAPRQLN
jgi:hypothetical protein